MKITLSNAIRCTVAAVVIIQVQAAPMPTSVEIVPVGKTAGDSGLRIGNVRVRFADGHSELWTKQGRCSLAKVAKNGLIGWTRLRERGNDSVRLMTSTGQWVDFWSGYPFIDDWDVSTDGKVLLVRSGFAHGPSRFEMFDLQTQKLLEQTVEQPYSELPAWARPLIRLSPEHATPRPH